MAGKATFESASASWSDLGFSGSYMNGKRGVRSVAVGSNLDRSGNVREGSESRKFGLGFDMVHDGSCKASDEMQTFSECVSLEPIVIRAQISWGDDLRRVLGLSVGSTAVDNSFCPASAAHVKPLPPVAVVKDLKWFRLSVEDTCVKARVRANQMDERLRNLDRYCEAVTSKKQHKSELVSNDRPSVLSFKMAIQTHSVNQRVDRPKNILLNKRVRTSVAESRAECQSNGLQTQPVAMTNDGNVPEDNDGESDLFEKIRRLAAGGEGWDKKVKRNRSGGTLFTRPIDSDGVPKRVVQNKIANERGSQPRDEEVYSNRKRPMPLVSSSPPMAQWVGQRPQKMARARRPSLVSAVSNQDPNQISFKNPPPSDIGARLVSNGTNGSPISRNATNGPPKLIVKLENVQSPARLSENEESLGGETRLMGKKMGNSEMSAVKKNKPPLNAVTPKPFQSSKDGYKKNGSKPSRRLKKLSDRKGFPDLSPSQNRASDDDREELLAAANHARIARHLTCSSRLWKKMEPVFASVSSEYKSLLFQQTGLPHENSLSDLLSSRERKTHIQHPETESLSESNVSIPFYQRVLSALIIEDDIFEEGDDATYDTYGLNECESFPSNVNTNSSRSSANNNICEDVNAEVELLDGVSNGFLNTQQTSQTEGFGGLSPGCEYEKMFLDEKLLLELQSIGLYPDELPGLNDKEDETLQREVDKLKSRLHQQEVKKKAYLEKICKGVESNSRVRDLETLAMDGLVELAYRRLLLATKRSRSMIYKVPKQTALAFGRRTLARCHKFETSGTSCFSEPPYQDILSAPIENEPDPKLLSDEAFTTNRPISNRCKKKELLLDDIGTRAPSYVGVSGGTKGNRSERDPTKSRKPKPRQKSGQIPVSGSRSVNKNSRSTHPTGPTWPSSNRTSNESSNRSTHPTGPTWPSSKGANQSDTRWDGRFASNEGNDPRNPSLDDLDPLDELGVGGALGGPADLNSFLNFDDQDLEEDFAGGLDIPMDDLTELF